jgi:peptidoglycan/LPS O-acetylase OafA/YrhL
MMDSETAVESAPTFVPGRVERGRIRQFDGLRTWAISGVFFTHYLMSHKDWLVVRLDPGYFGVRLFFVLSGFLITGILLNQKTQTTSSKLTLGKALKLFYLRRMLRLSPIYYLTIVGGIFYFSAIREHPFAFLLYLQNYVFILYPETFQSAVGHLWTLAIEEQFYLVWPLFIFLCPKARLPGAVAGITLFGALVGFGLSVAGVNPHIAACVTPANFVTLGLGSLVAVLGSPVYGNDRLARKLSRAGILFGPVLLGVSILLTELHFARRMVFALKESGSALFFAWAIGQLSVRVPRSLHWALLSVPVCYVGTISYAVYLFHMPLIDVLDNGLLPWVGASPPDGWFRLFTYSGCSIGLAALSWWLIESRIAKFKDRLLRDG